jgi:hypothetical protein
MDCRVIHCPISSFIKLIWGILKKESRDRRGKNTVKGDKYEEDEAGIHPVLIDCFLSSGCCES